MIHSLSDAKRLVADMHNSILESLERKDTEIKRQSIDLLRDLYEECKYRIHHKYANEIEFEATESFPDDWSSTGKRHHKIDRSMNFSWIHGGEQDGPNLRKGWNIIAFIHRSEYYHTNQGYYFEHSSFFISWSVSQKKWFRIDKGRNESKFTPR